MKIFLAIFVFLFLSNTFFSQGICYFYDAAGNRTSQSIDCVGIPPPNDDDDEMANNDKSSDEVVLTSKVYPNPTYGLINVEIPEVKGEIGKKDSKIKNNCVVQVYDESGKKILQEKYEDQMFQLDLSAHAVGRYVIRLSFAGIEESWQIIKN